jgi:hypothetical protein
LKPHIYAYDILYDIHNYILEKLQTADTINSPGALKYLLGLVPLTSSIGDTLIKKYSKSLNVKEYDVER